MSLPPIQFPISKTFVEGEVELPEGIEITEVDPAEYWKLTIGANYYNRFFVILNNIKAISIDLPKMIESLGIPKDVVTNLIRIFTLIYDRIYIDFNSDYLYLDVKIKLPSEWSIVTVYLDKQPISYSYDPSTGILTVHIDFASPRTLEIVLKTQLSSALEQLIQVILLMVLVVVIIKVILLFVKDIVPKLLGKQ